MKPDDAKEILTAFGMPKEQQNPNAVYTLLAFANVGPRTPWGKASSPRRTPHDVIAFSRDSYQKLYAENTRETIRRQAIHQFVQGGLLAREPKLTSLGVPVTKHDKLPDVVLYDENRNWLFLIEAVTSHGPVSSKRHIELESVLTNARPGRVYVSAFPSFREFKKYADEIAWETEVWVAEFPDHLLHYNGDRFFGPRHSA